MHTITLSPLGTTSGNQEATDTIASSQRPHVCIVEHVTSTRHILETFLKQEGFTVEAFACGISGSSLVCAGFERASRCPCPGY